MTTQLPTVVSLLERHARACEFRQPHDPDMVAFHLRRWIAACGGPDVVVTECKDWASAARAARDASAAWAAWDAWDASAARAAWDASAARAAWAAWAAWDASAARAARAAWAAWDASWVSCWAIGAAEINKPDEYAIWGSVFDALDFGLWNVWPADKELAYIPLPTIHHESGRPHCEDGPALISLDLREYFLNGVLVDEQIVMRPETQTVEQIRSEQNEEVKRLRIERFGWPKFLSAISADCIDSRRNDIEGTRERLYRAFRYTVLVCACPSTAKVFALEVPPEIDTCERAQKYLSSGLSSRIISAA